jgi:hypothetical protein
MSNLYFYIIRITDPSKAALDKKSFTEETLGSGLGTSSFFFKKNSDFWIFTYNKVESGGNDIMCGEKRIGKTIESIKTILQKKCKGINFDKMLFGIHGSDYGIEGNDYAMGDIFFPQSIHGEKYPEHVNQTNNFFNELKQYHQAKECKVKLFSHAGGNTNTIYKLFTDKIDDFLKKQYEIFSISHDASSDKKDVENDSNETNFITALDSDIVQLDRLETLFFKFRVCLTALKAISGEKDNPDLINRILNELKFLLEGGGLVRRWEEELTTRDGNSLEPNQFTEKCNVLGIGHYLYIFNKNTQTIVDYLNSFSNGSDDMTGLIEKLDNVEKAVQELIETKRKEPKYKV